jgi:hypothetical protein
MRRVEVLELYRTVFELSPHAVVAYYPRLSRSVSCVVNAPSACGPAAGGFSTRNASYDFWVPILSHFAVA